LTIDFLGFITGLLSKIKINLFASYSKTIKITRFEYDTTVLKPHEMKHYTRGIIKKKTIMVVLSCVTGKIEQETLNF